MSKAKTPVRNGAAASQAKAGGPAAPTAAQHRWTFFTNHAHVLILLYGEPELVLREVAAKVGITERAVQRIVQELEEGGFLERERVGRRNRYRVPPGNHLRHPIEAHCQVSEVLKLVVDHKAN